MTREKEDAILYAKRLEHGINGKEGAIATKNRVRELRERLGITQEQLGAMVGASRQAIHAIEAEKFEPSIWLAYDIARVFACSIEEVFLFEESPRKSRSETSRRVAKHGDTAIAAV